MTQHLIKYGFLFGLMALSIGCKKVVIPEPEDDSPVFFTDLSLGDLDLNLTAGESNYELRTRFATDRQNVMTFVGAFRPRDCAAAFCPESLKIVIRDIQRFNGANFNVDQSLRTSQDYLYGWDRHIDSVELTFKVDHDAPNNVSSLDSKWELEDARIIDSGDNYVTAIFDRNIKSKVVLVTMIGREKHRQIQTIDFDLVDGHCRAQIVVGDSRLIATGNGGKKPYTYKWRDSDQTTKSIKLDRSTARKTYAVTITDANKSESYAEIENLLQITSDRPTASADFRPGRKQHVASLDTLKLGNVEVDYFDESRKGYSSRKFSQPPRSTFEIISISDFMDNAEGERTKKMEIELKCVLYGENVKDTLPLKGKITMAVAYPN